MEPPSGSDASASGQHAGAPPAGLPPGAGPGPEGPYRAWPGQAVAGQGVAGPGVAGPDVTGPAAGGWPGGGPPPGGWPQAFPPAYQPAAAPRPPRPRHLAVTAGLDRGLVIGALAGGLMLDLAWRSGLATVAATAWVAVTAAALLLSGRVRGSAARLAVGGAAGTALLLFFRSSPWVLVPVIVAVTAALLLGVSLGADGGGPASTFPVLGARMAVASAHLVLAPGMLRSPVPAGPAPDPASHGTAGHSAAGAGTASPATAGASRGGAGRGRSPGGVTPPAAGRKHAAAAGRGVLLGAPVLVLIWALLAAADPIFRSWFDVSVVAGHVVLVLAGAWAVTGLARAASARRPAPRLPRAPVLGTVEAGCVLGGLCALYAVFVAAQLVALSGAGHRILVTRGLTYAEYARSGFFQLLGCAVITLVVLLTLRACAAAAGPALTGLFALTAVLTIAVVIAAFRRLQLYEAAYGLTMLRLACMVAAAWIGVVFALTALSLARRGLPRRYLPAAVLVSALVFTVGWGIASPAAIVARVDLSRSAHGRPLDVSQAASLGPDAMPALLSGLRDLRPAQAAALRRAVCAEVPVAGTPAAFSEPAARARAAAARAGCAGLRHHPAQPIPADGD
jgi:hypothetical protein